MGRNSLWFVVCSIVYKFLLITFGQNNFKNIAYEMKATGDCFHRNNFFYHYSVQLFSLKFL